MTTPNPQPKKPYQPSPMVNWFEPRMLFQTGLRSVVSSLFGNYADRRETEAALSPVSQEEWDYYKTEYKDEIWMDYIGDTGDGFNSTFSVASLAAKPYLTVINKDGKPIEIPRAKLLFLGGDQVYPTPAGGLYKQKFTTPFETALPEDRTVSEKDTPHMYAIPGNHDWYDGLSGFLKLFCQQRKIGNWQTKQHRSYFARPLPCNYWIWGTDIQLDEDIDKPQLDYFQNVATTQMEPGAKVILITAEPAWIYKHLNKDDKTYDRFRFFIDNYIVDKNGKRFELATVLTGDLHHYSHYCTNENGIEADHYFGAGGGGAFMHLTHNLPKDLDKVKQHLTLEKTFPSKAQSKKMLSGNLSFFRKNTWFSFLIGIIYLFVFWILKSNNRGVLELSGHTSLLGFLSHTCGVLLKAPFLCILSVGIIAGFWKFTDTTTYAKGVQWFGALHGLWQCTSIYASIWLLAQLPCLNNWYGMYVYLALLIVVGGIWGGFIMGIYLYLSNRLFGNHIDEASSSLMGEDYKCFLRMHIKNDQLTVYPIGIKTSTKKWHIEQIDDPEQRAKIAAEKGIKTHQVNDITVGGHLPHYHLIEPEITIISNQ
jgi:hypothetical protein